MVFNSQQFMLFFVVVYGLFLLTRNRVNTRNLILLIASYIFYGSWDWRFLSLIILSTIIDYWVGIQLGNTDPSDTRKRRSFMMISLIFNLGMLGIFKYFNFFVGSFVGLTTALGFNLDVSTLYIILPVGISFYTFQTLSYSIDIYRGNLEPSRNLITFATFVAFFPQLVAGPIERASNLLPQLNGKLSITPEKVHSALFLILWGYYKKVAIADNVAIYVNQVFGQQEAYTGLPILLAIIAFALQIYCDFSGYSDIARGVARLMGIELMVNFRLPYFALTPSDFWNRWHISLSSWLRDYLYIPLGGNRHGQWNTYRNMMLTMVLGGLWHGAAWNFVLWGAYHGTILILYRHFDRSDAYRHPMSGGYSRINIFIRWSVMIAITLYGWLLFRSNSLDQIIYMSTHLFVPGIEGIKWVIEIIPYILPLIIMQIAQSVSKDLLIFTKLRLGWQVCFSVILLLMLIIYGQHGSNEFIYFQF